AVVSEEPDAARIAGGISALLAGALASPEETFFAVRRFLGALAQFQPVVLAIDDLQWAEPLLLDLVEHLIQWTTDVPLLVLVAARPELREARSSLATPGGLVTELVTLAGLDAAAATRLAASVIGADQLPAAVAGRVLATSEGNPLFVGELVRMLVQDGALVREGDRWTTAVELARLEMPPTIQALLAARIERLRPEERSVLEHAAVVGRHFSRGAVAALLGQNGSGLDARLEALRRTELIEPDTGWFLGEPVLRFHHVLIRDAAYRRLLRSRDPQYKNLPLATLGDSLVLLSRWVGASGAAGGRFDVGEYGNEALAVFETGDALVRLYERYAERLPEGSAAGRARVTAQITRAMFEAEDWSGRVDEALARFDAQAAPEPFANAATRASERESAAVGKRDWDGFA
ncbi:MAG: hypothetical protein ACREI7_08615, partial [Myxococcota bacterium]